MAEAKRTPPMPDTQSYQALGTGRVPAARYDSPSFADLEWRKLWRYVWNMGPRVEEIPKPGDYVLHDLGKEPLLFVRDNSGAIRGFYNVCRHRGNQLCWAREGSVAEFSCVYHGWRYGTDGRLAHITDRETFPQLGKAGHSESLDLVPIHVDTWGGWIFFNLNPDAEPLLEYLGDIPAHLDAYQMDRAHIIDYKTFEWDCNWKTSLDAFNESYHFGSLHPQLLDWGVDEAPIELMGLHSRMINQYGRPAPRLGAQPGLNDALRVYLEGAGLDPADFESRPQDVRVAVQQAKRALEGESDAPYATLNDDQLTDAFHYLVFPNVHFNLFPEFLVAMRHRPHQTGNPRKMYFDFIMFKHLPPGERPRPFTHRIVKPGEMSAGEALEWGEYTFDAVNDVLGQDVSTMPFVQRGMESESFEGLFLGEQEMRIRHFHANLDSYIEADRS